MEAVPGSCKAGGSEVPSEREGCRSCSFELLVKHAYEHAVITPLFWGARLISVCCGGTRESSSREDPVGDEARSRTVDCHILSSGHPGEQKVYREAIGHDGEVATTSQTSTSATAQTPPVRRGCVLCIGECLDSVRSLHVPLLPHTEVRESRICTQVVGKRFLRAGTRRTFALILLSVFLLSLVNVFCNGASSSSSSFIRPLSRSPDSNPFLHGLEVSTGTKTRSLRASGAFERRLQHRESVVSVGDSLGRFPFFLRPSPRSSEKAAAAAPLGTEQQRAVHAKGCSTIGRALHIWGGSDGSLSPASSSGGDGAGGLGGEAAGREVGEAYGERAPGAVEDADCLLRGSWWPTAEGGTTYSATPQQGDLQESGESSGGSPQSGSATTSAEEGDASAREFRSEHSLLETASRACASVGGGSSSSYKPRRLEQVSEKRTEWKEGVLVPQYGENYLLTDGVLVVSPVSLRSRRRYRKLDSGFVVASSLGLLLKVSRCLFKTF